jgi:aryl-alcohol dehydrogenase-like predicted oxidoreductase
MLRFASQKGVDLIDTAISYGDSENCLGELGTEGFKLVTKLPAIPEDCFDVNDWVKNELKASMARMRVTSVYGLLLHRPYQLLDIKGSALYKSLQCLKENGIVQKIGISVYSPQELDDLMPKYPIDLVQAPFNLIDRRLYRSGWLKRLKEKGVELHTRSTFLQGLLLLKKVNIPENFSSWDKFWHKWHNWLAETELSPIQACLAFSLSFKEIDKIVVGADNLYQLTQILNIKNSFVLSEFPNLECKDENLINPTTWKML